MAGHCKLRVGSGSGTKSPDTLRCQGFLSLASLALGAPSLLVQHRDVGGLGEDLA